MTSSIKKFFSVKKNKVAAIVISGSLLLIAVAVTIFIVWQGTRVTYVETSHGPAPVNAEGAFVVHDPEPFRDNIDFAGYKERNADTIAWVEVPGTDIDHPVMRGIDNEKYLTTSIDGEYDIYGTVFADMLHSDDLVTPLTILYGHYTSDGSFFTDLHNYKDSQYFEENKEVFLYTPYKQDKYSVVAAFVTDDTHLLYERDMIFYDERQEFLDWIAASDDPEANIDLAGVTPDDNLLALSTCVNVTGLSTERYVVIAKLEEQRWVSTE